MLKDDFIVQRGMRQGNTMALHNNRHLLDKPCLATGLHTHFVDNYLHSYPACTLILLPSHMHTHGGTQNNLQAGTYFATVR